MANYISSRMLQEHQQLRGNTGDINSEEFKKEYSPVNKVFSKRVLLLGGPRDGELIEVDGDKGYISFYYTDQQIQTVRKNGKEELTLVINEDGEEEWVGWSEKDEFHRIDTKEFMYEIFRVNHANEYVFYIGIDRDNDLNMLEYKSYDLEHIVKDTELSISDVLNKCYKMTPPQYKAKGLYEQISESNTAEHTYASLDVESFIETIRDLFTGTSGSSWIHTDELPETLEELRDETNEDNS